MKENWDNIRFYFEKIPKEFTWFKQLSIWQWHNKIPDFLVYFFGKSELNFFQRKVFIRFPNSYSQELKSFIRNEELYFTDTIVLKKEAWFPHLLIYLAKGVKIEAGASIQKNCIVLEKSEIRQSAYIQMDN